MKLAALLLFALLPVACKPGPARSPGQAYYQALNCRACHRIAGDGAGRGGPDLTLVGFHKSPAWLDRWLANPQAWKADTLMPNPRLSDTARAALVEYLSSLQGQAWGANRPWNAPELLNDPVERGRVLYAKAGCATCHGRAGLGGSPNNNVAGGKIPALTGVAQSYTKEELKRKIARGVAPAKNDLKGEDPLLRMPSWGDWLSDDEISAVADYLWTLKPGAGAPGSDW